MGHEDEAILRTCYKCKQGYPRTSEYFYQDRSNSAGLGYICKSCERKKTKAYLAANPGRSRGQQRDWHARHPGKHREYALWHQHGLTTEEFSLLLARQNNMCLICDRPLVPYGEAADAPYIDHDHNCCPERRSCVKCRRGILCTSCNHGIGRFFDNPKLLRLAAAYLENFNG